MSAPHGGLLARSVWGCYLKFVTVRSVCIVSTDLHRSIFLFSILHKMFFSCLDVKTFLKSISFDFLALLQVLQNGIFCTKQQSMWFCDRNFFLSFPEQIYWTELDHLARERHTELLQDTAKYPGDLLYVTKEYPAELLQDTVNYLTEMQQYTAEYLVDLLYVTAKYPVELLHVTAEYSVE